MTISVCIPTYNRWMQLRLNLLRLEKVTRKPDEIVVCDDGSIDETVNNLRQLVDSGYSIPLRCFYLPSPEYGCSSRPRNVAIRNATSSLILDTASDMFHLSLDLLGEMERLCKTYNRLVVAGNVFFMGSEYICEDFVSITEQEVQGNSVWGYGAVNGAQNSNVFLHSFGNLPTFMYKKEWIVKIGGYDESFSGWGSDDFDIVTRIDNYCANIERPSYEDYVLDYRQFLFSNPMVHIWHERGDRIYSKQDYENMDKQKKNALSIFIDQPSWGILTDDEKELNYKMGIAPETGCFL